MGEVYKAHDPRLKRDVALKVLPAMMAPDAGQRQRFEREAQALAALNHPNIVTVYSVEEAEGLPFLTMEFVDGKPLANLIPRKGLSLETFFKLAIPLADALGAAHHRGITHRDLKPKNIMVTGDGRVKVLDFGLAKLREHQVPAAAVSTLPTEGLTGSGWIIGTVAYMIEPVLDWSSRIGCTIRSHLAGTPRLHRSDADSAAAKRHATLLEVTRRSGNGEYSCSAGFTRTLTSNDCSNGRRC
jgi:serine/threonine protein kinase